MGRRQLQVPTSDSAWTCPVFIANFQCNALKAQMHCFKVLTALTQAASAKNATLLLSPCGVILSWSELQENALSGRGW